MSEERIQKIKSSALIGAAVAMGGVLALQMIARFLIGSANVGISSGQIDIVNLLKSIGLFGLVGATSGAIGGMFTEINEKARPTRVKREGDDEDEDNEAARETMAKLGIVEDSDRDRKRRAE